jgi:hypothetical protein
MTMGVRSSTAELPIGCEARTSLVERVARARRADIPGVEVYCLWLTRQQRDEIIAALRTLTPRQTDDTEQKTSR